MKVLRFLIVLGFLILPLTALAHPLGNFTINHHVAVVVGDGSLEVDYVVDLAEIPAFAEIDELDTDGNGLASNTELESYARITCPGLGEGLSFELDDERISLETTGSSAVTQPGQNDVPTLRVQCDFVGTVRSGELTIENTNYSERIGWAEVIVSSGSTPISTDLPAESRSNYLTEYPQGDLAQASDVRTGSVTIGSGSPVTGAAVPILALSSAFDSEKTGFLAGLIAVGAALALGATHALAPGHGKTIVAAYLVGTRGTPRQAYVLAGATAISHTAGVAILGVIAATASVAFEPTKFYPYLSTLAGVVILVVGGRLLWVALKSKGHGHSHPHEHGHAHESSHLHEQEPSHTHPDRGHTHDHGDHSHDLDGREHGHGAAGRDQGPSLGWKSVAALGLSGGLVPSASAVVLLLGAIQLGRAWFGVVLVSAFGIGMATALVASGLLAVAAHRYGWKWFAGRRSESKIWRWIPVTAASAVVVLGLVLTLNAVGDLPIF